MPVVYSGGEGGRGRVMNDLTMCFVSVCVWRWRCLYHVTGEVRWRRGGVVRGMCIDRLTASA